MPSYLNNAGSSSCLTVWFARRPLWQLLQYKSTQRRPAHYTASSAAMMLTGSWITSSEWQVLLPSVAARLNPHSRRETEALLSGSRRDDDTTEDFQHDPQPECGRSGVRKWMDNTNQQVNVLMCCMCCLRRLLICVCHKHECVWVSFFFKLTRFQFTTRKNLVRVPDFKLWWTDET